MNDIDIANAFRSGLFKPSPVAGSTSTDETTSSKSLWERMPIMIRKETKLGLAIGGVVLAVVVVWVLAVSGGGGDNKQQVKVDSATGSAQQTGTASAVSSSQDQKPAVTLEPIASDTPKTETTNTNNGATASAADAQNSAKTGDVDWGKLLNGDQPMLAGSSATPVQQPQQTQSPAVETPAQTPTAAPAQAPATDAPKTEPSADNDATTPPAGSSAPAQTPSASAGAQPTASAAQTTEPQFTQPANEQVAIANSGAQQQGQSEVLPQAAVAPPQMTTIPPGPSASDSTAVTSSSDSSTAVAASSASGKQRTHVIQKNETLSSISLAAYGSANYYPHILRANPGLDDKRMKVGQTIVLPDVSSVKPSAQDAVAGAQNAASGAQFAAPAAQIDSAKEYKVAANDSLYRISVKLYGKSDMAGKIYELNKQQIGEDPAKLKLGMVLKLPSPPTVTPAR